MNRKMLHLLVAQLKYINHKNIYSILPIHIFAILYGYIRDFNPLNLICFFLFTQYISLVLLNNSKENRDYTFSLLVISVKEIAFSRVILAFIGYLIIYSIALGLHIFLFYSVAEFKDSLHELFMFGGLSLCGIFLYVSVADYFSMIKAKSGFTWFNVIMSFIIAFFALGTIISVENSYLTSVESSPTLIVLIYLCSLILASISYVTYIKRESYLGYK